MANLHSIEEIRSFVAENKWAFLYVSQQNCSVCHSVLPKLKQLLAQYPDIQLGEVDGEEVKAVSAEYQIFSAPTLLLFIDGKEFIREGRFVQFQKLGFDIERLYTFETEL
ncbi:thioredoxin family protein [Enterococcus sp. LJL128]